MRKTLLSFIDICLIALVCGLGFLTISKSLGAAHYSSYFERLVGSDKALHVIAGFVIVLFFYRLVCLLKLSVIKHFLISGILAVSALVFDEFLQVFFASRHANWTDIQFGLIGCFFGFCFVFLWWFVCLRATRQATTYR